MKKQWLLASLVLVSLPFSAIVQASEAEKDVPVWVGKAFADLAREGILDQMAGEGETLTRQEAAELAAEAIWQMEDAPEASPDMVTQSQQNTIDALKREFAQELADMGYGALDLARKMPSEEIKWLKVDGELRYNYVSNDDPRPTVTDDSRLRLRLYGKIRLNENWYAYTMAESDRSFFDSRRHDGTLRWNRYYVKGTLDDATVMAGHFGQLIAEGNIYDSTFRGMIVEFGDSLKWRAGWGNTTEHGRGYLLSARGNTLDYDIEGGLYRYDDHIANQVNTIGYLGGNYALGNYWLGAMYLRGSLPDSQGDRDGYVLTLGYGKLKTWMPGTYSLYAKYYDQARGTYIMHTMTGTAGYMDGFKGIGMGLSYTVTNNLVYGLDFFDIEDKFTGEHGKTIWSQFTYYF